MKRELTSHRVNILNEALHIAVLDEPGHGNACHEYAITLPPASPAIDRGVDGNGFFVAFQNGPIAEAGVNGISNEALLAIVEDRLKGFQSGPYTCDSNATALTKVQEAMEALHSRTRERTARGVEGTHQV